MQALAFADVSADVQIPARAPAGPRSESRSSSGMVSTPPGCAARPCGLRRGLRGSNDPPLVAPCTGCGRDPKVPRAVRYERRRRRWWLVAIGAVVLGAAVWGVARPAIEAIADRPWAHVRPVSWVLRDVGSSDKITRADAWMELSRRVVADELDAEAVDAARSMVVVTANEGPEGEIRANPFFGRGRGRDRARCPMRRWAGWWKR